VFIVPKEGAPANDIRVHIAEGTKNRDAADKFVNHAVSQEAMNCLADKLYIGPPTKEVKLSEKAKARMPWGAEGSVKNLAIPDWDAINVKRQALTDVWNRQVVGR
jgi:putative spermidine/putrescine transport system substrate-binding protein